MKIPAETLPSVNPSGQPLPGQRIAVSPEQFGGSIARAEGNLSGSLAQASDLTQRSAMAFLGLQNETRAKEMDIKFSQAITDLQFNPQTGFQTKLGKDAVDSYQDTSKQVMDLYKQFRAGLPNADAQRMFDQVAVRRADYATTSMAQHAAQQNKQWIAQTNESRIGNEINQSALYWNDDAKFGQSLATIRDEAIQRGEIMGSDKETVQKDITHYQSEAWGARITSVMAHDPEAARQLYLANADQIDAPHRAQLDARIEQKQYTDMMRQTAAEQRAERLADKAVRDSQAAHFGTEFANVVLSGGFDPDRLATMVKNRQLTPEQFKAIQAEAKAGAVTEDYGLATTLLARAKAGDMSAADDAAAAADQRQLKGSTVLSIVRTATAASQKGDDQVEKGAFATLRSAMGFDAQMQPIVDLGKQSKAEQTASWVQAQMEWTDRVLTKHQPPTEVLSDMLAKYASPKMPPEAWPSPKFGTRPLSIEDTMASAQQTEAAKDNGTITQDEYDHQKHLIALYAKHFEAEAAKAAAATNAPPGKGKVGVVKKPGSE